MFYPSSKDPLYANDAMLCHRNDLMATTNFHKDALINVRSLDAYMYPEMLFIRFLSVLIFLEKLPLFYLLVGGAVDLGASKTTCGRRVKLLSPTKQQVAAGWVTGPLQTVVARLRCCHQRCWEEGAIVSLHHNDQ